MGVIDRLAELFGFRMGSESETTDEFVGNPASGLPMIGGRAGVDSEVNLFGTGHTRDHSDLDSMEWTDASRQDDLSRRVDEPSSLDGLTINPANGLPMIDGTGSFDIEGNLYGTDGSHDHQAFDSASSSSGSPFDDWSSSSAGSGGSFDDW